MAEYDDRERFIPVTAQELVDRLCQEPGINDEDKQKFREFSTILGALFHFEYHENLQKLKSAYDPFNPDKDTVSKREYTEEERQQMLDELMNEFKEACEAANYCEMSQEELDVALEDESPLASVDLDLNLDDYEKFALFYRGEYEEALEYKQVNLGMKINHKFPVPVGKELIKAMKVYKRFAMIIKLKDTPKHRKKFDVNSVYMKLFKKVPALDIEALFPTTVPRLKKKDMIQIYMPVIMGVLILVLKTLIGFFAGAKVDPKANPTFSPQEIRQYVDKDQLRPVSDDWNKDRMIEEIVNPGYMGDAIEFMREEVALTINSMDDDDYAALKSGPITGLAEALDLDLEDFAKDYPKYAPGDFRFEKLPAEQGRRYYIYCDGSSVEGATEMLRDMHFALNENGGWETPRTEDPSAELLAFVIAVKTALGELEDPEETIGDDLLYLNNEMFPGLLGETLASLPVGYQLDQFSVQLVHDELELHYTGPKTVEGAPAQTTPEEETPEEAAADEALTQYPHAFYLDNDGTVRTDPPAGFDENAGKLPNGVQFMVINNLPEAFLKGVIAGSIVTLLILFGTWTMKSVLKFFQAKEKYRGKLAKDLYFTNLDNNAGVFSYLIDAAEEEECKEAFLAAFFLNVVKDRTFTEEELDDFVEEWIEKTFTNQVRDPESGEVKEVPLLVDFEIDDALGKLERLELMTREQVGDRLELRMKSWEQVLERIDYIWDNYFEYNQGGDE